MHQNVSTQPFIPFKPTLFLAVCWSVHNPEETLSYSCIVLQAKLGEPKKTRKWTKMTKGVNNDLAGDMIKGKVETKDNKWGSEETKCDN